LQKRRPQREGAKYKQPVVQPDFAAMALCGKEAFEGDLNFCLLLFQDKSKMPLRHRADEESKISLPRVADAQTRIT
jgi:hypothetical protein